MAGSSPGDDDSELRYFVVVSLFVHVVLLGTVWVTSTLRGQGARATATPLEIQLVHDKVQRPESASRATEPVLAAHATHHRKTSPPPMSTASNGADVTLPLSQATPHLCLRNCAAVDLPRGPLEDDEPVAPLAPNVPAVLRQKEAHGVRLVRYADGGRLLSSTIGPQANPDFGALELADLADGRVGARTGRDACNPYVEARAGPRTLVLLVDTSASVGNVTTACAAGAALAALDHDYQVEIFNFSTRTLHQPPTRDGKKIYDTLSAVQGRGTVLLDAHWLMSARALPRDFVLITDSGIQNLESVLPSYRQELHSNADDRGLLYLIGEGWGTCKTACVVRGDRDEQWCEQCGETSTNLVDELQAAGFTVERIADAPAWQPRR